MDSSLRMLVSSPLFTFTLTDTNGTKDLQIHSAAIAEISPVLKGMIESPMSEGISKRATLPDVEYESFSRVCQFAYRRQYADPEPRTRLLPSHNTFKTSAEEDQMQDDDKWSMMPVKKGKKKSKKIPDVEICDEIIEASIERMADLHLNTTLLASELEQMHYPRDALPKWSPPVLKTKKFDYSPVLIGHAKLYSVAKLYMCDSLCNLVLYKIHSILKCFVPSCPYALDDVVALIDYIYDDYHLEDDDDKPDQLRHLVTLWAATKTKHIGLAPQFTSLLERGGTFVRRYWILVAQRLLNSSPWVEVR